jgi:trehalose-phosphatase
MNKIELPFKRNHQFSRNLVGSHPPALFSDLDGMLSKLMDEPSKAIIDPPFLNILTRLDETLPLITIIYARSVKDLKGKMNIENLIYVGNHGAEKIIRTELFTEKTPLEISNFKLMSISIILNPKYIFMGSYLEI